MNTSREAVRQFMDHGKTIQWILHATDWSKREVVKFAQDEGFGITEDGRILRRGVNGLTAPVVLVEKPQASIIEQGLANPSKRIQNAAHKAQAALDKVAHLIAEDAGKAEARAEVERLARELREARASLRTPNANGRATSDAKQVREWAKGAGVPCPERGQIPKAVREQYAKAVAS